MTSTLTHQKNIEIDDCLHRLAAGEISALERLYELTSTNIYGYALSLMQNKSDAEDVMHDLYVSVYSNAALYSSRQKPLAWMLTITRNLAMAKLKEKNRSQELTDLQLQFISSEEKLSPIEKETLRQTLRILNDEERQIVVLHSLGFRHMEIAATLAMPLPTVLTKYHRALKKLRKELEK